MLRLMAVLFALLLAVAPSSYAAPPTFDFPRFELKFDKLEEALQLTPDQKEQYELAVGATKRMILHVTLGGMQLKERLQEELSKSRPNFGVLRELRTLMEDGKPLRREARDEWKKLYSMLNEEQVARLKRYLGETVDPFGLLEEFLEPLLSGTRA
jgi:hypothetical protein